MEPGWVVRPCRPGDAEQVRAVWQSGLSQTYDHLEGEARQKWVDLFDREARHATGPGGDLADIVSYWQRSGEGSFLVATDPQGDVQGCIAIKTGRKLEWGTEDDGSGAASVWRMSVAAGARRKGVGSRLMQAVEQWAEDNGFTAVQMMTANKAASAFYESLDYQVFKVDGPVNFHLKVLRPQPQQQQPQQQSSQEQGQCSAEQDQCPVEHPASPGSEEGSSPPRGAGDGKGADVPQAGQLQQRKQSSHPEAEQLTSTKRRRSPQRAALEGPRQPGRSPLMQQPLPLDGAVAEAAAAAAGGSPKQGGGSPTPPLCPSLASLP